MIRYVTIILILFSNADSWAARQPRLNKPQKCERSLVSEDVMAEFTYLAQQVAQLTGSLHLRVTLKGSADSELRTVASDMELQQYAATLADMKQLVEEIRANFSKSADDVNAGIKKLAAMLNQNADTIRAGLQLADSRYQASSKPSSNNFQRNNPQSWWLDDNLGFGPPSMKP